jgi:hypothetical protein
MSIKIDLERDQSIKAMENPISAIFDLSENVNEQTPRIKRMVLALGVFVLVWLVIDFLLALIFLAVGEPVMFLLLVFFFVLGAFGLYTMYYVNKFFKYFERRHLAIKLVRDADELVYMPKASDSAAGFVQHLKKESPELDKWLRTEIHALHHPAILLGASGVHYHFDAYIFKEPGILWKSLGIGDSGYALFIKVFKETPSLSQIQALERAIQDISMKNGIVPSRVVALVETKGDVKLDDDVYEHVTTMKPVIRIARQRAIVNVQVVSVDEDGSYDFVPVIAIPPGELP